MYVQYHMLVLLYIIGSQKSDVYSDGNIAIFLWKIMEI